MHLYRSAGLKGFLRALLLLIAGALAAPAFAQGPAFFAITNLRSGDTLNIRSGPSTQYRVVGTLPQGAIVENYGCTQTGATRWCQVEASSGLKGWASARYLTAYSGGSSQRPPRPDPMPSGPRQTVKCKANSGLCINAATNQCGGSFAVISSESHAGGLIADTIPGPVTWYSLTFQCGPSNNVRPRFPFQGPDYNAPRPPGSGGAGRPSGPILTQNQMPKYCAGEASGIFNIRPEGIRTLAARRVSSGYVVWGQTLSEYGPRHIFNCYFNNEPRYLRLQEE